MGVSLYLMGTAESISMPYSALQRVRHVAILGTISLLENMMTQEREQKSSKKIKLDEGDNNDNEESSSSDSHEDEISTKTLLEHIQKWCLKKQISKPFAFDSEKNSINDLYAMFLNPSDINYKELNESYSILEKTLIQRKLIGLAKFVNHSDCEGYHSYGDCVDINQALKQVVMYVEEDQKERFQNMVDLFAMAVENETGVVYS